MTTMRLNFQKLLDRHGVVMVNNPLTKS